MVNPRYHKFAQEYVTNGRNITQAAISAGYSPRSAYSMGSQILKKPEVLELVKGFQDDLKAAYEDKIRDEIAALAFAKISDYVGVEGETLVFREDAINDPTKSRAIKQIKNTPSGIEIVFYDKQKALDQLARMIGVDAPARDEAAEAVQYVFTPEVEEMLE